MAAGSSDVDIATEAAMQHILEADLPAPVAGDADVAGPVFGPAPAWQVDVPVLPPAASTSGTMEGWHAAVRAGIQALQRRATAVQDVEAGRVPLGNEREATLLHIPTQQKLQYVTWTDPTRRLGRQNDIYNGTLKMAMNSKAPSEFTDAFIVYPNIGVQQLKTYRPAIPDHVLKVESMFDIAISINAGVMPVSPCVCSCCGQHALVDAARGAAVLPQRCSLCLLSNCLRQIPPPGPGPGGGAMHALTCY